MKAKQFFFFLFLTASLASFGQTSMTLTSQEQALSQQFKTTAGSDRTVTFGQLKHLIVTKSGNHTNSTTPTVFTNRTEIISLLGPPDFQRGTQLIGYYLNSINGPCMVVFGINQTDSILYFSIYDCN
ncbi:MAG: hypothetical protein ACOVSR_10800 [Bacteroidia bacterium]|jgi:hypothetical protein